MMTSVQLAAVMAQSLSSFNLKKHSNAIHHTIQGTESHHRDRSDSTVRHSYPICIALKQALVKIYLVLSFKNPNCQFSFEAMKTEDFIKVSASTFACSCQYCVQISQKRGSLEM